MVFLDGPSLASFSFIFGLFQTSNSMQIDQNRLELLLIHSQTHLSKVLEQVGCMQMSSN